MLIGGILFVALIASVNYGGCGGSKSSSGSSNVNGTFLIFTDPSTNVTYNLATLHGRVNPGGRLTTVYFRYGTTSTCSNSTNPSESIGAGTTTVNVSYDLTGLSPHTLYYFKVAANRGSITYYGSNQTFTTEPASPICTTDEASDITYDSARLNGTVNPNGAATDAYFEYGISTNPYPISTTLQPIGNGITSVAVSATVSSLTPNTLYNFRVVGINSKGTNYGNNLTFTTGNSSGSAPTCTTDAASNVITNSARLNGTVIPNGVATDAYFEYGISTNPYPISTTLQPIGNGITSVAVSATVSSLTPNTLYNFRVVGTNGSITTTYGNNLTFTTLVPPTCTTNDATNITHNSATLNGTVNPNGVNVTSCYFEYGNTQSYGRQQNVASLPGSGTSPISVTANVISLLVITTYNFRVVATNAGGTTNGLNQTFNTSVPPPPTFSLQEAYVKASNTETTDDFGYYRVAISGDTMVVGARFEDSNSTGVFNTGDPGGAAAQANNSASNSGAVYVFQRSGATWSQQAYIKASNTEASDGFGSSVAISGDIIVVGAYGEDSNATGVFNTGDPGEAAAQANNSASMSGAVYVFQRSGATWSQQAYIKASNTGASDNFGNNVAISGDTIVVGAYQEDSSTTGINSTPNESASDSGAVYVFTRSGATWSQQAYIKASNTGTNDKFSYCSVAISGDTIVVGAIGESSNATGINGNQADDSAFGASGAVYVFQRSAGTWSQQAYIKASNTGQYDNFGYSVAISGDTVVVAATGEASSATGIGGLETNNSWAYAGAVYVFQRSAGTWSQQAYIKASNTDVQETTGGGEYFGISVDISCDTIVVGARGEDSNAIGINGNQADNSAFYSGAAYVFQRSGATWSQQAYIKASNTEASDFFGYGVAISGDTIVVGAWGEDSNATGINGNQTDNSASSSGAVYVFR